METFTKSNRLVAVLDRDMHISYGSGIQTVFLNSYLYNEFVVRPEFKLGVGQSLWVTFARQEDIEYANVKTKPTQLAMRNTDKETNARQVYGYRQTMLEYNPTITQEDDTQTNIPDTGAEYWIIFPDLVLNTQGTWYFSLEVREVPDETQPESYTFIADSDVASFAVNNSLANGDGSIPTDLNIQSLYNTAVQLINDFSTYLPRINPDTGNWETYDAENAKWVDTGVSASGNVPQYVNDHIEDFNNPHETTAEQVGAVPFRLATLPETTGFRQGGSIYVNAGAEGFRMTMTALKDLNTKITVVTTDEEIDFNKLAVGDFIFKIEQ